MLSLVIYAGASQFLALALVTGGAPVLVAAFTLIAMNVRHVLYGPALMKQAGTGASRRHAWAWAWGLTDEVFGQALGALARGGRFSEAYMFGLGLAAYAAWVSGTGFGAWAGGGALEAPSSSSWMKDRPVTPWNASVAKVDWVMGGMICGALAGVIRR